MNELLIGFLLALAISIVAYLARALNTSGAVAACVLGTIVFGLGGMPWAVLLVLFFVTSSVLSRAFKKRKARFDEKFSKGSRRDAGQVLANGGIAGVFVLLHALWPQAAWPWLGFAGALAAANADTWATELGVLGKRPVLLSTWQPVEPGASGGVSLAGTLAAFSGALVIAAPAALLWPAGLASEAAWWVAPGVALAGLVGSLVDSLLGATIQAIYTCPTCHKETERHPLHTCGTPTTLIRGLPWLDNDWVNTACTLAAGILAALIP